MANKKVPADRLADEINKILEEYKDDLETNVDEVGERVAKKGLNALKSSVRQKIHQGNLGKRYAKGWRVHRDKNYLKTEFIIHNATVPGMAHLLEKGHALPQGGRARAIEHIAPIERELNVEYSEKVREALKKA